MCRILKILLLAWAGWASLPGLVSARDAEDRSFISRLDGSEQRYVITLPAGVDAAKPVPLLIALHGHGSDRWQFIRDERDECRAARDTAHRYGMLYVSPDYRARTSWMGPAAEADLLQIIDSLRQRFQISRVVLCGGSMGGTSALTFAALHPEKIDGVVAMNGTANHVEYTQFQDAIAASFGGTKQEKPDEYRRRSAELNADKLTMPVAMTTGGQDTLVPPDSVLRLADVLSKQQRPVRLIHRPDGGHSTTLADATAAFDFVMDQVGQRTSTEPPRPLLTWGTQPATIVCLGDSVTGVYYHTGGRRAYPEMLELAIRKADPAANVRVINAGISGHTTRDGLARFDRDVLKHQPALVTISFGLNDMGRLSEDEYRANLETLVSRSRMANAKVVLCTPNSVLTTAGRPIEKLQRYCDILRDVAKKLDVPVCDQFTAGEAIRAKDAWIFRRMLSDEIHPNMDGHKKMAEELCRTITARSVALEDAPPLLPALVRTRSLVESSQPVTVLAMPPFDKLITPALQQVAPGAVVNVKTWPIEGKSLRDLEKYAQETVRTLRPDLVLVAVPAAANAETDEEFLRSYTWVLNWSLAFGHLEWDCLVVHPDVAQPESQTPRGPLIRQIVRAQDLILIDRGPDDPASPDSILGNALRRSW